MSRKIIQTKLLMIAILFCFSCKQERIISLTIYETIGSISIAKNIETSFYKNKDNYVLAYIENNKILDTIKIKNSRKLQLLECPNIEDFFTIAIDSCVDDKFEVYAIYNIDNKKFVEESIADKIKYCYSEIPCNDADEKISIGEDIIKQWQGTYSFDFGGVQMGEEFEGSVTFKIGDKLSKVSFKNKEEILEAISATKDTLKLQNTEGDIYKIYKDEQGSFNVSGHTIYMLNPPNKSYLLTKEK